MQSQISTSAMYTVKAEHVYLIIYAKATCVFYFKLTYLRLILEKPTCVGLTGLSNYSTLSFL